MEQRSLNFHTAYLANYPKGSSETTREATLKNVYNSIFLDWFIGFTEGDGCFSVSQKRCFFIITQAEPDVLYRIKHQRGMGSVTHPEPKVWRYTITAKSEIFRRIHIFNGNRILEKRREQFKIWLKNWNLSMAGNVASIPLNSRNRPFDIRSSWFSGFADAKGCFNLQIQKNSRYSTGYRVRLRFIIDQKDAPDFWPQYEKVMESGSLTLRKASGCYRWIITDLRTLSKVADYFSKFPLRSRKRISFLRWYKCSVFRTTKKHLTLAGMQQILRWKKLSKGTL